jgi:competence protein ComEC
MVALLVGGAAGLILTGRHPAGLESRYGLALLALALLLVLPLRIAGSHRPTKWSCLLLMSALFGCGLALLRHPPITPAHLAYYNDLAGEHPVMVAGHVAAEPVYTDKTQRLRVAAELLTLPGEAGPRQVTGDVYVVAPRYPSFSVGEGLIMSGTLTTPPTYAGFDFGAYLARQGILSYMAFPKVSSTGSARAGVVDRAIAAARSAVREAIRRAMPEPQAALAVGVVTGDRSSLPEDIEQAFQRSGTTHILAISGQNITLIVGVLWLVLGRPGASGGRGRRRMPLWLFTATSALLAVYTVFTGASPSVVRAAIMGVVLLAAPLVGRRYDPVAAVALSATAMMLFDHDVLADAGFQLSFGGMLGIALVTPYLYRLATRARLPSLLAAPLSASLGAQSLTGPLTILLWGQISLVGVLATLSADLALLPLMVGGICTGVLGSVVPLLGWVSGLLTWLPATWLLWWVQVWASIPWAAIEVQAVQPTWVVIYYCALALALWAVGKANSTGWQVMRDRRRMALACTGAVTALVWLLLIALAV